ncbi:hypothetical protein SPRG_08512 [Saprolegnia parasitica CBS 223.65]|uniref:Uncharacterized protein n=1 Tax=Saprolegnia parasitica (strain CBS 223.65) TaxID=695850 RepID=A0A067CHY8_SAPPC|nr:hypothetical protein SPRG_08512 [Saprolegnia parasitica CBS 223.65]KDO26151.1 hypothetical protein SPRG_08512 [Saprolegnia parasitica CBS 223.65]|eukprot:XP_012203145.1 hypothetical protein SPRG_08512 [Saprolegnia parasitica CBS 223.65]
MRSKATRGRTSSAEEQMDAKEAFAANLRAKIQALRQAPPTAARSATIDEDVPVLLARKPKRKRTEAPTAIIASAPEKTSAIVTPATKAAVTKPGPTKPAAAVAKPLLAAPKPVTDVASKPMSKSQKKKAKKMTKSVLQASTTTFVSTPRSEPTPASTLPKPTPPTPKLKPTPAAAVETHAKPAPIKANAWDILPSDSSSDDEPSVRKPAARAPAPAPSDSDSDDIGPPPTLPARTTPTPTKPAKAANVPTQAATVSTKDASESTKAAIVSAKAAPTTVKRLTRPVYRDASDSETEFASLSTPTMPPRVKPAAPRQQVVDLTNNNARQAPTAAKAKTAITKAAPAKPTKPTPAQPAAPKPVKKPTIPSRKPVKKTTIPSPTPDDAPKPSTLEEAAKAMKRLQARPVAVPVVPAHTKLPAGKAGIYASIIDAAAVEGWDLVEMGRLVRLFCAPFHFKRKSTTKFLQKHCPEFVCADFLEGLNIPLHGHQIVALLRAGSTSPSALSAKLSACLENDVLKIQDDSVLTAFVDLIDVATMSRDEIFGFAHGIIESLRTVDECCRVLRGLTTHWGQDAVRDLVQRILLSPVFDDLEGDPEASVSAAFPLLTKLDFPSRLDMEDTNAEGNLDDLCVDDETIEYDHSSHESDDALEDMEARIAKKRTTRTLRRATTTAAIEEDQDDDDGSDDESDEEEASVAGESEDDDMPHWKPKAKATRAPARRSRFILDEASEDEDEPMESDVESSDEATSD